MEGRACCWEGLVPGALEVKYIPKGLVKVNKSNMIRLMCVYVYWRRYSNSNINSNFNSSYKTYKIDINLIILFSPYYK
jgi:hypothetical protein